VSRWGAYGGRPLLALCLVGLVDAVDRFVLAGVLPDLQRDLGISDTRAGLLSTAVIVAAVLVAVPGGVLADRRDRRVLIGLVLGLWACATALASAVQSFWQLLLLRAALGAGDSINDPAAQSLVADYYAPEVRGRAYAFQRVVPTVGTGIGLGLGAAIGALFGWRVAVLAVALPGLAVALLVRRLPLPPRTTTQSSERLGTWPAVREALAVPTLRRLLVACAIVNGILSALGFWGVSYHVRASGMSEKTAGGLIGGLILLGAIGGGILGGQATDRFRGRVPGWPMLLSGAVTGLGTVLLLLSFVDGIPVYAMRLPLQTLGVAFVVAALPPITVITAEVVPVRLRGTAFGLLKLFSNVLAALTPPLIGRLADSRRFLLDDALVGDLGFAFRVVAPVVLVGSLLMLFGRNQHDRDVERAAIVP
jgi:MFS family permease